MIRIIIFLLLIILTCLLNKKNEHFNNELPIYDNINYFLNKNNDKNIIFCIANNSILEMVKNLVKSADKNNIKLVLFALDEKIVKNMKNKCVIVKYFSSDIENNKFYKYGTEEFKKVIFQRFLIGNEILKKGKTYIYLDVDIVINKNFESHILNQFKNTDYDCLIQFNGTNGCTGFFAMRPTKNSISFNLDLLEKYNYKNYNLNQPFFNGVIVKNNLLKVKYLNRAHYPTGEYYYKNHKNIDKICKIIHFNCVTGYQTKINKMKEYNKWNL